MFDELDTMTLRIVYDKTRLLDAEQAHLDATRLEVFAQSTRIVS